MKIDTVYVTKFTYSAAPEVMLSNGIKATPYDIASTVKSEHSNFRGMTVQSEDQMADLVESLLPPGYGVFLFGDGHPNINYEDDPELLTDSRLFEARLADNDPISAGADTYYIEVSFNYSDEPRREQVSLTISSALLRALRNGAKKSGVPLSRFIDRKLTAALKNSSSNLAQSYSQTIADLESALKNAKLGLEAATNLGAAIEKSKKKKSSKSREAKREAVD